MSTNSSESDETMESVRSPTKLSRERYQEGMKVMFVNTLNFRLPAFVTGTLGPRDVSDPEDMTFAVEWETPINNVEFCKWYDDIPLIMDGVDKEDEIKVRSRVHEA